MPTYEYECSACGRGFEVFESMTENAEYPTPHCPECDPERERPSTMYKYFGNVRPAFKLGGEGVHKPGWH